MRVHFFFLPCVHPLICGAFSFPCCFHWFVYVEVAFSGGAPEVQSGRASRTQWHFRISLCAASLTVKLRYLFCYYSIDYSFYLIAHPKLCCVRKQKYNTWIMFYRPEIFISEERERKKKQYMCSTCGFDSCLCALRIFYIYPAIFMLIFLWPDSDPNVFFFFLSGGCLSLFTRLFSCRYFPLASSQTFSFFLCVCVWMVSYWPLVHALLLCCWWNYNENEENQRVASWRLHWDSSSEWVVSINTFC